MELADNIVKISLFPKLLHTIKILIGPAVEIGKFILKFVLNFKEH